MSETNGSAESTESKVESTSASSAEPKPEAGESGPPPGWEAAKAQVAASQANGQLDGLSQVKSAEGSDRQTATTGQDGANGSTAEAGEGAPATHEQNMETAKAQAQGLVKNDLLSSDTDQIAAPDPAGKKDSANAHAVGIADSDEKGRKL
jgi:hypothetical protein